MLKTQLTGPDAERALLGVLASQPEARIAAVSADSLAVRMLARHLAANLDARARVLLAVRPSETVRAQLKAAEIRIAGVEMASHLRDQMAAGDAVWFGAAGQNGGWMFTGLAQGQAQSFDMMFEGLWSTAQGAAAAAAPAERRRAA